MSHGSNLYTCQTWLRLCCSLVARGVLVPRALLPRCSTRLSFVVAGRYYPMNLTKVHPGRASLVLQHHQADLRF